MIWITETFERLRDAPVRIPAQDDWMDWSDVVFRVAPEASIVIAVLAIGFWARGAEVRALKNFIEYLKAQGKRDQ